MSVVVSRLLWEVVFQWLWNGSGPQISTVQACGQESGLQPSHMLTLCCCVYSAGMGRSLGYIVRG
jgi:hypothetical protein